MKHMSTQELPYAAEGEKLRTIRATLKLTQEEMAESIDLSQAGYSYLEKGKHSMSLPVFINLIRIHRVNPWAFLSQSPNEPLFMPKGAARDPETLRIQLQQIGSQVKTLQKQMAVS